MFASRFLPVLIFLLAITACKNEQSQEILLPESDLSIDLEVKYAKGFEIERLKDVEGYQLTIINPWPNSKKQAVYFLLSQENCGQYYLTSEDEAWETICYPIKNIVTTSTTHIPPLVLLQETEKLIGFPDTDYISSPAMRLRIDNGKVVDLGSNETINLERTISLGPDLVMGYGIDGDNPTYQRMIDAGIPVLYNADWTEQHPLGRAEWIKVFGILFDKEKEAFEIFSKIEKDYLSARDTVKHFRKPKIIAGATWKDTWYLPYGNSWQGTLISNAGGDYIYKETKGSGSLAYNLERVLKDAQQADFWIAPGQYTSYSNMLASNNSYQLFEAFKNKQLFTFALRKGATGGVIYYEEASMRPDLVLKDLILIFHGDTAASSLYFFDPLKD